LISFLLSNLRDQIIHAHHLKADIKHQRFRPDTHNPPRKAVSQVVHPTLY